MLFLWKFNEIGLNGKYQDDVQNVHLEYSFMNWEGKQTKILHSCFKIYFIWTLLLNNLGWGETGWGCKWSKIDHELIFV